MKLNMLYVVQAPILPSDPLLEAVSILYENFYVSFARSSISIREVKNSFCTCKLGHWDMFNIDAEVWIRQHVIIQRCCQN